jgi:hypothetical protein
VENTTDRAFLHSLEVEFGLDNALTEIAILAQGLFSSQICLIDQHVYDNAAVCDFFMRYEHQLLKSVEALEDSELPLLGTCCRGGADCLSGLDKMLEPRNGIPPRLGSLSHQQYAQLAQGYTNLSFPEDRRAKLLAVKGTAGQTYFRYLQIATSYFQRHPDLTVISPLRSPEDGLFAATEEAVQFFQSALVLPPHDDAICSALRAEISRKTEERKTRQRLHHVIYGTDFPAYHDNRILWSTVSSPRDTAKDEWRYLINHIYNRNLCESFGLDPAQDFRPKRTRFEEHFEDAVTVERAGPAKLECPIYIEYLTLEFVLKVRKGRQFWNSLRSADPVAHRQFISQKFAQYLTDDCKRPDLVSSKTVEIVVVPIKGVRLAAPPVVASLFFIKTLPLGLSIAVRTAKTAYEATEAVTNRVCRGLEDYFATFGEGLGRRVIYNKKFLSFIDKLEDVTRRK